MLQRAGLRAGRRSWHTERRTSEGTMRGRGRGSRVRIDEMGGRIGRLLKRKEMTFRMIITSSYSHKCEDCCAARYVEEFAQNIIF